MSRKFIRFHKNFNKLKKINGSYHKKNIIILKKKRNNYKYFNFFYYKNLLSVKNKYNKNSRIKNVCLITAKYKTIFRQINLNRKFLKTTLLNNKVPNIEKIYW